MRDNTPDEQRIAWLWALLEDYRSLQPGTTRAEVEKLFQHCSVGSFREAFFYNRRCEHVQVELEFVPFDGCRYDTRGLLTNVPHPGDTVWRVGKPYLEDNGEPADPLRYKSWLKRWIQDCFRIHPGVSRQQFEATFRRAGGPFCPFYHERYCHRVCDYIEVVVEFQPYEEPEWNEAGYPEYRRHPQDLIREISRPYLTAPIMN
jgi:hypothetical protein